jgi:hypothetical protein
MPVATQAPPTQPPVTPDPAHRFADAVEFSAALEGARA